MINQIAILSGDTDLIGVREMISFPNGPDFQEMGADFDDYGYSPNVEGERNYWVVGYIDCSHPEIFWGKDLIIIDLESNKVITDIPEKSVPDINNYI